MSCETRVFPITFKTSIASLKHNPPFLAQTPGCSIDQLNDEYAYAFNYASPNGVLLFSNTIKQEIERFARSGNFDNAFQHILSETERTRITEFFNPHYPKAIPSQDYWVHITNSCNLGCFYCYISDVDKYKNEASDALSKESATVILQRALEDAQSRGICRLHFKFAGGEPSLALLSMRAFCQQADQIFDPQQFKVTFGMISNGVQLSDELLDFILERKLRVSLSIDGMETFHDRTRHQGPAHQQTGSWKTIMLNAERLQKNEISPYFLHTLTPANLEGVQALQTWLAAHQWNFRISLMRLNKNPSLVLQERYKNVLQELFLQMGKNLPLPMKVEKHLQFAEWNIYRKKKSACGSGRNYLAVDAQANLSSCQMVASEPLGDLKVVSVEDGRQKIRNSEALKYLADPELRTVGGCSACYYRYTCTGGCPQHTAQVFSTMDHVSPWCYVYGSLYPIYIKTIAEHEYRRLMFILNHHRSQ